MENLYDLSLFAGFSGYISALLKKVGHPGRSNEIVRMAISHVSAHTSYYKLGQHISNYINGFGHNGDCNGHG
jgi:hypothetical protein